MQTVCLIGKSNVGKSTIFNRLIKEKKAIIMDTPNITRDRIYGTVNYKNKSFHLIDTGGITLENSSFGKEILMQATLAIDEADVISQEWAVLKNPKYKGMIYMYDSIRDMFMIAEKDLGYSMNTKDETELAAAAEWLAQVQNTMEPAVVTDEAIDGLATGEKAMV